MLNWTVEPGVRLGPGTAISDSEPNDSAGHPFAMTNGDGSVNVFFTATAYYTGTTTVGEGIAFATSADGLNFTSETLTSVSGTDGVNCMPCGDVTVYPLPNGGLRLYYNNLDMTTGFNTLYSASSVEPSPGAPALVAAVLPSSRSVEVGATATAFATIINAGFGQGLSCQIVPVTGFPSTFTYQTTNPATNAVTGTPNSPVNIPAGAAQSFVVAVTPTAALAPTNVQLSFMCSNGAPAPSNTGLNTLLFSASTTPVPDIVALAASGDPGIVDIAGANGDGDFAVATVNLGAAASITATANTGSANLPMTITLCETNSGNGQCLQAPSPSVTTTIAANATPTFGIFVVGNGTVPFDPANNRVFVSFADSGGTVRGSTSVAVRTQ
jgi:hypothetical protein